MLKVRQDGDLLTDTPTHSSWRELCTYACDRECWKTRVRAMRQSRVTVEINENVSGVKVSKKQKKKPKSKTPTQPVKSQLSLAVKQYRDRDAHTAFFMPRQSQRRKHKYNARCKKRRSRPEPLIDKQRAAAARADRLDRKYVHPSPSKWSPVVLEHHRQNQQQLDTTIPTTPPSINSVINYHECQQENQQNLANFSVVDSSYPDFIFSNNYNTICTTHPQPPVLHNDNRSTGGPEETNFYL